jgi:hypothetical protein
MDTVEGKAILKSPNGAGVAFLLSIHKDVLGRKTDSKVTVFEDDRASRLRRVDGKEKPKPPGLVFHIVDVPESAAGG